MSEFKGVKIRCENWYWSRKVQLALHEAVGCQWRSGSIPVPWNTHRKFLVVQMGFASLRWYFMWATKGDFDQCPLPEWSAKALFQSYISREKLPTTSVAHHPV